VWLFGKKEGVMPWATGPMYPMRDREDDDLIPALMVKKILKHLEIDADEQTQFWQAKEYPSSPEAQ